uniref:GDT1 family protein n=1 Tax=Clastoptera arizonana TaxID=38151 RepID=A0A1B6DAR6_9HEMI
MLSAVQQYKRTRSSQRFLLTSATMTAYVLALFCVLITATTTQLVPDYVDFVEDESLDLDTLYYEDEIYANEEDIVLDETTNLDEEEENVVLDEEELVLNESDAEFDGEGSENDGEDQMPEIVEDGLPPDIPSAVNLKTIEHLYTKLHSFVTKFNVTSDEEEEDSHEHAFATSFFVTVMSELGDRSFFMVAILAMHHSRTLTFIGATVGQTIMTLVAVSFGFAVSFIPEFYTQWASIIIMTFFGLKMIKDSFNMDDSVNKKDEHTEVQKDESVNNNEKSKDCKLDENENTDTTQGSITENNNDEKKLDSKMNGIVPHVKTHENEKPPEYTKGVMLQATTLCLMGEWGDKSQIATILLASNEDPYVVATGGILGHILCNVLAVFGGRMLASKFPAKFVTQMGGVFFLLAAASTIVFS